MIIPSCLSSMGERSAVDRKTRVRSLETGPFSDPPRGHPPRQHARVAEPVDAHGSEPCAERCAGSTPAPGTNMRGRSTPARRASVMGVARRLQRGSSPQTGGFDAPDGQSAKCAASGSWLFVGWPILSRKIKTMYAHCKELSRWEGSKFFHSVRSFTDDRVAADRSQKLEPLLHCTNKIPPLDQDLGRGPAGLVCGHVLRGEGHEQDAEHGSDTHFAKCSSITLRTSV